MADDSLSEVSSDGANSVMLELDTDVSQPPTNVHSTAEQLNQLHIDQHKEYEQPRA